MTPDQFIKEIESLLNTPLVVHTDQRDRIRWVMATKNGEGRYLMENNEIVGLNLANTGLTDAHWAAVVKMEGFHPEHIRYLKLSDNKLSSFPMPENMKALEQLDLSGNQINDLSFVGYLPALIRLDFDIKPVTNPPPEVVAQGFEAIQRHFKRLVEAEKEKDIDFLFEAKVLLVGRTGAGKTSLRYKLRHFDEKMPAENESTRGVDVEPLVFQTPGGRTFRMNIWDFEGQQISHQTHQFFLTKRSLYVFVADQRTEEPDFDYWFHIVQLLGGESPMMVFQNEKKAPGEEIGQICTYNYDRLRSSFGPFLCEGEHKVNLDEIGQGEKHDPNQLFRFLAFQKELETRLYNLPIVGTKLPRTWVDIRESIEEEASKRAHMPVDEFWTLCRKNGIENPQDQRDLSQLFHDLGIFLHFQSPERPTLLSRKIILQNEWATKAVYQVLKTEWIRDRNKGHFLLADLRELWKGTDYADHAEELLELMMRFEICYKVAESEVYIAPQLLPASPPKDYSFAQNGDILQLRYGYDFMPKGILTRLTVRMHPFIASGQTLAWKDGFVLENDESMAEVIETYGKKEIQIQVAGKFKKRLLNAVIYEIDRLNSTFTFTERSQVHKLLPCTCSVCKTTEDPYFFKHKELLVWKEEDWDKVPCGKSGKPAKMNDLLAIVLENDEKDSFESQIIIEMLDEISEGQKLTHSKLDDNTDLLLGMTWLSQENRKDLYRIFSALENTSRQQETLLISLLAKMEENLQVIVPQLPPESAIATRTRQTLEEVKVKTDLKGKFKLMLPLLPGILAFEKEISVDPVALFKKIMQDFRSGKIFTEEAGAD
jgi:internalin A